MLEKLSPSELKQIHDLFIKAKVEEFPDLFQEETNDCECPIEYLMISGCECGGE